MNKDPGRVLATLQLGVLVSILSISSAGPAQSPALAHDSFQVNDSVTVVAWATDASAEISKKKQPMNNVDELMNDTLVQIAADTTPPTVEATEPQNAERRVTINSVINATFSELMNASTINDSTFLLNDVFGDPLSGMVSYDSGSRTATFAPDLTLEFGGVYTAVLTNDIQDEAGNQLETTEWSFVTGGRIRIQLSDVQTDEPIAGSAFTITPNPFTLQDSLTVEDNSEFDSDILQFGNRRNGTIFVDNVENNFTTYLVSETVIPPGYSRIYGDSIVTAVQTDACDSCLLPEAVLSVRNILESVQITDLEDPVLVTKPYLNRTQFELYNNKVVIGVFSGVQGNLISTTGTITNPSNTILPDAILATNNTSPLIPLTESFNFETAASPTLTGAEIIDLFDVPTYPGPIEDFAPFITYAIPALVIPYEGSANNFVLTPIIDKVYPGLTLLLNQSSFVESSVASVRQVNMTFGSEGTLVGFSFGISDFPPPGTPEPPLDAAALFLDVGFVGNIDFSNPQAFQSSPLVDIVVNKTLAGFEELEDGCADFEMLLFNEESGEWESIEKLRNPIFDTDTQCGFTLQPGHFSKFAVGGVKGQTISTESSDDETRRGGGGGGSRSTAVTQPLVGSDIEMSIRTNAGTVTVQFESVVEGSGQLKVNSDELNTFEDIFEEIAFLHDNDQHGIIQTNDARYATAGDVFDIDASSVQFTGTVDVIIPYDEQAATFFGSESSVRFMHYNEDTASWEDKTTAVSEEANTVTGTLDSLSPVSAAIVLGDTLSIDDYMSSRIVLLSPSFSVSGGGNAIVQADMHSNYDRNQDFVLIVQVIDESDVVQHIDWQAGSLQARQDYQASLSLSQIASGTYKVQLFAFTELQNPWLLSHAQGQLVLP